MFVTKPNSFVNDCVRYVAPHSEKVQLCAHCMGIGKVKCNHCDSKRGIRQTTITLDSDGNHQTSMRWVRCSVCNSQSQCTLCSATERLNAIYNYV